MKLIYFLIGVIIGCAIGFILTNQFRSNTKLQKDKQLGKLNNWSWADSLDAVKAAPNSHKVIFENDRIRILEVILEPYAYEPMHTHRFSSIMFGPDNDTSQFDVIYYPYSYDSTLHTYFAKDSIKQHQGGQSIEPNVGSYMEREGPHRVKNLSNVRIDVFRVELKNDPIK
jgi:hypothetical protein